MEDDLDALPSFEFPKSIHSTSFEMPDASILASQRKVEITQEHEIKKYKTDSEGCLSCSESSDTELSSCLEVLQVEVPKISISIENPGLLLSDLDSSELREPFTEIKAAFLLDLVEKFSTSDANALNVLIKLFIASLDNILDTDVENYSPEDIHCQLVALSLIVLDRKCRRCLDIKNVLCILHKLNFVAFTMLNELLISEMAEHLLKLVTHCHNRLYLAELFVTTNSDKSHITLTKVLSKIISNASLCNLIGYKCATLTCLDMGTLHNAVLNGQNWSSLSAYEQYIAVLLINMVFQITSNYFGNDDESLVKEIIAFLSNLKSSDINKDGGNFLKLDTECIDISRGTNTSDVFESENSESEFVISAFSSELCKNESLDSEAKEPEDSQDPDLSDESFSHHAGNEPLNDLAQYWRALEATRYYGMRAGLTLAKHTTFHKDLNSRTFDQRCGICHDIDSSDFNCVSDDVRKRSKLPIIPEQNFQRTSDKSVTKNLSYRSINFEDEKNVEVEQLLAGDLLDQDILQYRHKISGSQKHCSPQTITAVYKVEVPLNSLQGPFRYQVNSSKLPWKSPLPNIPFNSRIFKQQRLLHNDIHNFDTHFRMKTMHSKFGTMERNSSNKQNKNSVEKKVNQNVQGDRPNTAPPELDTSQLSTRSMPQQIIPDNRCPTINNTGRSDIDVTGNTVTLNGKSIREYEVAISKAVLTGGPIPHIPTSALRQLPPKVPPNLHDRLQALKNNVDKSRVKSRSWYRKKHQDGLESSCSTVTCSSADIKSKRRDNRFDDGDCFPGQNTAGSISTETVTLDKQPSETKEMIPENISTDLEKCNYRRCTSPEKNSASIKKNCDNTYFDCSSLVNKASKMSTGSQQKIDKQSKQCSEIESSGEISEGFSSVMQSDRSVTSMNLRVLARRHCRPDSDMKFVPERVWASQNIYNDKSQDSNVKVTKTKVFEYTNIHYDSESSRDAKQIEELVSESKETAMGIVSKLDKDELSGYSHVTTTGLGFISHKDERNDDSKLGLNGSDNLMKSPKNSSRSLRSGKRNISVNSQSGSENCITLCTVGVQAALSSRSCDSNQQRKKHNKSTNSSESTSLRTIAKGSNDTVNLDSSFGHRLSKNIDDIERSKRCILGLVERALNKELHENEDSSPNDGIENGIQHETATAKVSKANGSKFTTTESKSSDNEDLAASELYIKELQEMRNNQIRHIQQEVQQLESLNRILDAFHPASPTRKNRGDPIL